MAKIGNEIVIHKGNYTQFLDPVVDGEKRSRGLIPRNYETHPIGVYKNVKPFHAVDMPLIPRSEWDARIKDMESSKSRLSDIRMSGNNGQMIPSTDQNGKGFCHTEDTECLTSDGWVSWGEYDWKTPLATVNPLTHQMEFQMPFERHVYDYDGPMLYSSNSRLDFGVTPDHMMYVRKWDESRRTLSNSYTFQKAGELGWYCGLLAAPSGWLGTELGQLGFHSGRMYSGDDFLALLSLICSDGYAGGSESTRNLVSFCCFDKTRYPMVAELARRVGFKEQESRTGVFFVHDAGMAEWVRRNMYQGGGLRAHNKQIPDIVKTASARQIQHFLEFYGDQNHGKDSSTVFYSASKKIMDDLQELHLRVGRRSSIGHVRPRTSIMKNGQEIRSKESYRLHVSDTDRLCLERKKHIQKEHYKGPVYCAAVPNHTLVTRRNGSVLVSSNCWAHSSTSATMLLRAVAGLPYVQLSAYAVACIIKKYADEGGWGAQSLDFICERGVPSSQFWPIQSMSRSNDKPETWENAKLHRVTEGWIDLQAAQYDRNLSFEQFVTCLLCRIPVVTDLNWWGHSICSMDIVSGTSVFPHMRNENGKLMNLQEFEAVWDMNDPVTAGYGSRIWNSWGDSWSDQGMGLLEPSKAAPDGSTAPRVTIASET